MAPDHQYALTRAQRAPNANNISKTTRQVVPQFLQKVYEMLNDPANSPLIRWSEAGDSFYVLDHERFARELLGRWFKHQNFNTFVRQLNMYGFHKIPHLQQGVLKGEPDTEYWHYEHPNFQRGQPDLLCMIQRKKPTNVIADESALDLRSPTHMSAASLPSKSLSPGQMVDIHTIINGITAIKRHQQTISAELNELKNSNQMLWQDAMAARARHQKHQDTINRILRFLAGVFGHQAGQSVRHEDNVSHRPSTPGGTVVSRQPTRLMIEQGPRNLKDTKPLAKVDITEVEDEETPRISTASNYAPSEDFSVGTPMTDQTQSAPTSPSTLPADAYSILRSQAPASPAPHLDTSQANFSPATLSSYSALPAIAGGNAQSNTSDSLNQNALSQFLSQPAQLQKLLTAWATHTIPDTPAVPSSSSSQLTSYDPPFDFARQFSDPQSYNTLPLLSPPSPAPLPAVEDTDRLETTWKANEDVEKEVDALQSNISSLIETLGLDPSLMESTDSFAMNGTDPSTSQIHAPGLPETMSSMPVDDPTGQPEFDFAAFLNEFSNPEQPYVEDASQAFLDEVPSPSASTASPASISVSLPTDKTRKRKSDVAELETTQTSLGNGTRSKKKR